MQKRNFFSPPKKLLFPSFGLDLSDRSIKYVEIKNTRKGPRLGKYGREKINPGILQSGKILDSKALKEIFKKLKEKIDISYVRVSLPEEQVYLFSLKIPRVSPKEVETSIELSLEEHIPIPVTDVVFDYELIKEDENNLYFVVVASSADMINSYLELFEGTGFFPLSFELEAQAIARAIISDEEKGSSMIVDVGETRTGLCVVDGNKVVMASTVDIGGASLTNLIKTKLSVSSEAAEKWKREFGLEIHDEAPMLPEIIMGSLSAIRDEINKLYVYWQTHKDENDDKRSPITKIYLCGGESALKGFPEYLESSLGVPVLLGNPWQNVTDMSNYIPEIGQKDALAYATAIGLALGDK